MDPVSLIVTALAASAVAGAQNTATEAVKDAYTGLKELLRHRFAIDRPPATPWSSPLTSRNRCMPN